MDPLTYKSPLDVIARVLGVGIFVIENYNHFVHFETEIVNLVHPALEPLPIGVAKAVHAATIVLGMTGSISVREA